jgi:O-antigen ligase
MKRRASLRQAQQGEELMQLPSSSERVRLPAWLLKAATVLVLTAYCLGIGYAAANNRDYWLLLLVGPPALFLGLSFAFRYFQLLVLALPITSLILPYVQLPAGEYTMLPASLLLAIGLSALWAVALALRGQMLAASPLNAPILSFGAVCVLSLVWGLIWRDPGAQAIENFLRIQLGALAAILVSLSASLLIGNFVTTRGQLKYIVGCFLVLGTAMTFVQLFKINQIVLNDRGLWGTWLIACAYGLLIAQPGLRWPWRLLLGCIVLLTFYQTMIVNSYWLSGWVPSIIAVVAITFLRSWKMSLGVAVIGGVALMLSLGFFQTVAQDNINDGSLVRLEIWRRNWSVTREHWLLGTGPAGYAIYYMSYFPDMAYSTHNNYLDILSQFGFVGMALWLWLMGVSVYEGWRIVRQLPSGFLKTTAIIATGGWIAALFSMIFGDWVLPFAYNQGIAGYKYTVYSWIFLGVLIALRRTTLAPYDQKVTR